MGFILKVRMDFVDAFSGAHEKGKRAFQTNCVHALNRPLLHQSSHTGLKMPTACTTMGRQIFTAVPALSGTAVRFFHAAKLRGKKNLLVTPDSDPDESSTSFYSASAAE